MKKLTILTLILIFACQACTVVKAPVKRPLSNEHKSQIGTTNLTLDDNNYGIGASWFRQDSTAAGSGFGLIGAVAVAIIDAAVNAGPSARSTKAAEEISNVVTPEYLNTSFMNTASKAEQSSDFIVSIGQVERRQPIGNEDNKVKGLSATIRYTLAEDASAIKVTANVSYTDEALKFVTPYKDEKGNAPKVKNTDLVYKNTFTYQSTSFPLPEYSPELEAELIQKIEARYQYANGNFPVDGDEDYKKMEKELEDAKDGKLSKSETSIFLIRKWIENEGGIAFKEIEKAHEFIVKHLLLDLNRGDVPSFAGEDTIIETAEGGRVVRLIGAGYEAGSIVSTPGNQEEFVSFGNAVNYSKENRNKVKQLKSKN